MKLKSATLTRLKFALEQETVNKMCEFLFDLFFPLCAQWDMFKSQAQELFPLFILNYSQCSSVM